MPFEPIDPLEVCTLDPDQLADRLRWIRAEILSHALFRERLDEGIAIEISDVAGMRDQIDHWIGLEGECCGSVRFERHASRQPNQVRVEILGVDPNGQLFAGVPERIRQDAPVSSGRVGRILSAGGLGAVVSVFLLCVLPMGIVTLLGATAVAVPLGALDEPLLIGLGAAVSAGLIWRWMGRRRRVLPD